MEIVKAAREEKVENYRRRNNLIVFNVMESKKDVPSAKYEDGNVEYTSMNLAIYRI